jgi:hypothetical protein
MRPFVEGVRLVQSNGARLPVRRAVRAATWLGGLGNTQEARWKSEIEGVDRGGIEIRL